MKLHRHAKQKLRENREQGSSYRGRIWLEKDGRTFLGFGRVVLLERIQEHGSITGAARSMQMSYKHAWDLVDSMNQQADKALVVTSKGGKGGGGARLSKAGQQAVAEFHELQSRFQKFLQGETDKLRT